MLDHCAWPTHQPKTAQWEVVSTSASGHTRPVFDNRPACRGDAPSRPKVTRFRTYTAGHPPTAVANDALATLGRADEALALRERYGQSALAGRALPSSIGQALPAECSRVPMLRCTDAGPDVAI